MNCFLCVWHHGKFLCHKYIIHVTSCTRETFFFDAASLTVPQPQQLGDRMKGGWCLWGRGPESDQGTSLSGTGHPFKCSHSNEWAGDGWGGLNELRPTWPLGRGSKEEKWCCFINKLLVTNGVLSGEFCTVCVCGGTPASASAPGLIYVTSSS